jgi:hypothetical protein
MDYQGVAILIGAVGTFLSVLAGVILQVLTFLNTRKMERAGLARDAQLATIATHVNGMNEIIARAGVAQGRAEGVAIGVAQERADPQISADK